MKRKKQWKIVKNSILGLFVAMVLIATGLSTTVWAKTDTFCKNATYDATEKVAIVRDVNINGVESFGVTFNAMGATISEENNKNIGTEEYALISAVPLGEKAACVLEFTKPIDASKIEYLTMGMFGGEHCTVRVYNSKTKNFIEDTAQDVLTFSTFGVEKKILVLDKYADEDGYVRNITFYISSIPHARNLMFDYFTFTEFEEPTTDLVLKPGVNVTTVEQDLGESQIPTFKLNDTGLLKDFGWDSCIYTDGSPERIFQPGRYLTLNFDKVNTKYYEKIAIDFFGQTDMAFTMYAYGEDELYYNLENAAQIVTVKGREKTQIVLDAAKFADEYGYVQQVNLLLVRNEVNSEDGFQVFFGDITFKLPREYANVAVYTETLSGAFEKSSASTKIEGMAGDKVKIKAYSAEELGLYGYEYFAGGNNILSGVLQDGKEIQLQLYYRLKNCNVTVKSDEDEPVVEKVKYSATLDLMKYRKDNMLMNIAVDGLETEETKVTIYNDCDIQITQTPGNYVYFMVDGELYATRTYTPENPAIEVPLVPIKDGYVGSWENYELNGDVVVNAVYEVSSIIEGEGDSALENAIINVANKMEKVLDKSVVAAIFVVVGVALLAGVAAAVVIILRKKGIKIKFTKKQLVCGGVAVAVCCLVVAGIGVWSGIMNGGGQNIAKENYKFEDLYTSSEEKTIQPQETLTYNIDRELKDKSYIQIDVDSTVNLVGTIEYYNLADSNQTNVEDFFLEGASEESFYQFLDSFRTNGSGNFEKHLTAITLTNVSEEAGTVTVNKVAISDRKLDLTNAEVYVQNDYLKVGMDLLCGGALTYYEALPQDGMVLQEILDADGNVKLGLNYADKEGATLLNDSVNLINIFDKGREVQQSFYADVDVENGYNRGTYVNQNNRDWPYNPVQGGDQDDNSSQIIDYRVEENLLYVKTRAMDWGQHNSTTKSYMENWYTLDEDALIVKNRYIDWNGFIGEGNAINCEMPAVYFAHSFNTYVAYDGAAPWTGAPLDKQSELGTWADGAYVTENPSEGWFAWVNEDDYGISMYVPGMLFYASGRSDASISADLSLNHDAYDSSMTTDYRPARKSDYEQCYVRNTSYTAPVIQTTMDQYVPLEYSYVIRMGFLDDIRSGYQAMDQNGIIDNSGLSAWD